MISSLRGRVLHGEADTLIVEVAGVGYGVAVTPQTARTHAAGADVFLHTSMIVREDALSLYGFAEREELSVFTLLLSVTGVGPKSALGVLAALTPAQIATAVAEEDDAPFRRVSGIGPKTAKLIVLHLTGKLDQVTPTTAAMPQAATAAAAQLTQALTGLGWPERTAGDVAARVIDEAPADASSTSLLRAALAQLGPARKEATRG